MTFVHKKSLSGLICSSRKKLTCCTDECDDVPFFPKKYYLINKNQEIE